MARVRTAFALREAPESDSFSGREVLSPARPDRYADSQTVLHPDVDELIVTVRVLERRECPVVHTLVSRPEKHTLTDLHKVDGCRNVGVW